MKMNGSAMESGAGPQELHVDPKEYICYLDFFSLFFFDNKAPLKSNEYDNGPIFSKI